MESLAWEYQVGFETMPQQALKYCGQRYIFPVQLKKKKSIGIMI